MSTKRKIFLQTERENEIFKQDVHVHACTTRRGTRSARATCCRTVTGKSTGDSDSAPLREGITDTRCGNENYTEKNVNAMGSIVIPANSFFFVWFSLPQRMCAILLLELIPTLPHCISFLNSVVMRPHRARVNVTDTIKKVEDLEMLHGPWCWGWPNHFCMDTCNRAQWGHIPGIDKRLKRGRNWFMNCGLSMHPSSTSHMSYDHDAGQLFSDREPVETVMKLLTRHTVHLMPLVSIISRGRPSFVWVEQQATTGSRRLLVD